jgi:hypothetical protein
MKGGVAVIVRDDALRLRRRGLSLIVLGICALLLGVGGTLYPVMAWRGGGYTEQDTVETTQPGQAAGGTEQMWIEMQDSSREGSEVSRTTTRDEAAVRRLMKDLRREATHLERTYGLQLDYLKYDIMELLDMGARMKMRHPADTVESLLGDLLTPEDLARNRGLLQGK